MFFNTAKVFMTTGKEKTLAIIGASYLQLPLVKKAKEMGVRTVCFAWRDGAVCRDVCDEYYDISIIEKEKIARICRKIGIDGVTTIATDVAVPTVAYVAKELGLPGNSEHSAFISTNKFAMRQALLQAGANCPAFALIHSAEEAQDKAEKMGFPLIIKPCDRSGSMGVTKLVSPEQVVAAAKTALEASLCKEAILEEFIEDAREVSVEGISWNGEYFPLANTDKVTTGAPHYVELGHHQPSVLPDEVKEECLHQVCLGIAALEIKCGASHSELMITEKGKVYITEIGARMGGDFIGSDLVKLSTGYDFMQGVIEVALGKFHKPEITEDSCAGVWFYAPDTPQAGEILRAPEKYSWIVKSEIHEQELKELTRSADRAGYFIYKNTERVDLPPHSTQG